MKLIRFGEAGAERPGLLLADGTRVAAPYFCRDYDERFFASGGLAGLREWAAGDLSGMEKVPEDVRWGGAGGAAFEDCLRGVELPGACGGDGGGHSGGAGVVYEGDYGLERAV